jgi:hypothetical protein
MLTENTGYNILCGCSTQGEFAMKVYEPHEEDWERYPEVHHCIPCKWQGKPFVVRNDTDVPYGSTWATLEDFELHCPRCFEEVTEGKLPTKEDEE